MVWLGILRVISLGANSQDSKLQCRSKPHSIGKTNRRGIIGLVLEKEKESENAKKPHIVQIITNLTR